MSPLRLTTVLAIVVGLGLGLGFGLGLPAASAAAAPHASYHTPGYRGTHRVPPVAARAPAPLTIGSGENPSILVDGAGSSGPTLPSLARSVQRQGREISQIQKWFEPGGDLFELLKNFRDAIDRSAVALRTPDVVKVVSTQPVPANGAATADALCPFGQDVPLG